MALNKAEATQIMREAEAAVAAVFAAHGLKTAKVSASFDDGQIKVSLTGEAQGEDSPNVKNWKRYARSFGLPEDALGKGIVLNREPYVITGLAITRRKFPVMLEHAVTGKQILTTAASAARALGV